MIVPPTGTLFVDLDGTLIKAGTEEPLTENIEQINKAFDEGWLIILTTLRGDKNWDEKSQFNKLNSFGLIRRLGIKHHKIIWDSPSPRIVINDDSARAICIDPNATFKLEEIKKDARSLGNEAQNDGD